MGAHFIHGTITFTFSFISALNVNIGNNDLNRDDLFIPVNIKNRISKWPAVDLLQNYNGLGVMNKKEKEKKEQFLITKLGGVGQRLW